MKTDVAVIGAGPSGLITANYISKHGFSVEVFEEHKTIGYPIHCAGMISVEGFDKLGIKPHPFFHQNTVYGGRIFSKDGSCISIRDTKPRAYIIERGRFDTFLANTSQNNNVNINTGTRVNKILFKKKGETLQFDNNEVSSKIIIDAEGAKGRLLTRSGIDTYQKGVLNGFNVELDVEAYETDMVEVWLNKEYAKDFFTWVIPIHESKVRCGLASSDNNGAEALKKFIKNRFNIEAQKKIQGGLICTGGPINQTVYNRVLLVGDVAGHVKPTTGGGVVIGGLCAKIAGESSLKALEGEYVSKNLNEYEERWRKLYGSELQVMLCFRKILNGLNDELIVRVFQNLLKEGLERKLNLLVKEGDMDMQSGIIKRACSDPVILGSLMRAMGRIAVAEILAVFGF